MTLSIFSSEKLKNRYFIQTLKDIKVQNLNSVNKYYFFTESHNALLFTSFNMFKDKPLFGHGTKNFRLKCHDFKIKNDTSNLSCNNHPHNYYIQMLAENGILGFIVLISVFFYFLNSYFIFTFKKRAQKALILIIASNIVSLWPFITHGNFFNNWISIFIFMNFSFYIYLKKN